MKTQLLPLMIGLAFATVAVVMYSLDWGLPFTVLCVPVLVMYVIKLQTDIANLNENLALTQQHLIAIASATKKDFESLDESLSEDFHEMAKLIANERYGDDND